VVQNMAYLELMPSYECKNEVGDWDTCYPSEFCKPDQTFSSTNVRIDASNPYSLHNWVDQLDLTCAGHSSIGLLGTMVYMGWMMGSMLIPRLSDIYGRKKFFLGFQIL